MTRIVNSDSLKYVFEKIDQICHIPFPELTPLFTKIDKPHNPKLPVRTSANAQCSDNFRIPKNSIELRRLFQEIDEFCNGKIPELQIEPLDEKIEQLPKTKAELELFLSNINNFLKLDLDFKLSELNEPDTLIQNNDSKNNEKVQKEIPNEKPYTKSFHSKLLNEKRKEFHQKYSSTVGHRQYEFETKLLNLKPKCENSSQIEPNKRYNLRSKTKTKQNDNKKRTVRKRSSKQIIDKTNNNNDKIMTTTVEPVEETNASCLLSKIRCFQNALSLAANNQCQESIPKMEKQSRKRKLNRDALATINEYCSSGSVPASPASSYNLSSIATTTTSSCNTFSSTSTFRSQKNPNGQIIYLCDQLESFFAKKSGKRKPNNDSERILISKISNDERNQKVLEWTSRTLCQIPASCPTPKHQQFDKDTPTSSPKDYASNKTNDNDEIDFGSLMAELNDFCDNDHSFDAKSNSVDEFNDWLNQITC